MSNKNKINFKDLCDIYKKEALETLIKNIQIDSVYDPKTISKNAPYGKGVQKCFEFLKDLALKDGFEIDECDHRCLEIRYGDGDKIIGVYAHQDVVPVNGKWDYPPFGGEVHDDKVYGRGTSDDKGPGIASYYALKALKDNNLIKGYQVRLVFGGDEERGSSCLAYYFKQLKKPSPTYGFTPDGEFPLIYGEKGICNYTIKGKYPYKDIIEIDAGTVSNSVIDKAVATVKDIEKVKAVLSKYVDVKYEIEGDKITIIGKPAHGSTPELGINAGIILLKILGEAFNEQTLSMLAHQYETTDGKNLNARFESENLGVTTYNVGIIKYKNGEFKMVVNFRYPETVDSKIVINKIQQNSPFPIYIDADLPYLFYDPKTTKFIQVLAKVYEEESGDKVNKMMTIGGGTYAKEAKNTIAFGSHFPGKEDRIHSANEKIDLEDFYNSISIYARAIYELGNLNED